MKFFVLFLFILIVPATASDLSVLTWNTFLIPHPINSTRQEERADLMAKKLKAMNDDIIFFQEAFLDSKREQLINELSSGYPYFAVPKEGNGFFKFIGPGLFIVSKYPMKVLDQIIFDDCAGMDCFAAKGAILVEIYLPQSNPNSSYRTIQMVNTHLQAWTDPSAVLVRKKQLQQIKEMMKTNAKMGVAQVLVGDLNIDGKLASEYTDSLHLMEMFSTPLEGQLTSTNGFSTSECFDNPGGAPEGEWIDHLWLNSNNTDTTIYGKKIIPIFGELDSKKCPLSDHHAVRAQIEVKENSPKHLATEHSSKSIKVF